MSKSGKFIKNVSELKDFDLSKYLSDKDQPVGWWVEQLKDRSSTIAYFDEDFIDAEMSTNVYFDWDRMQYHYEIGIYTGDDKLDLISPIRMGEASRYLDELKHRYGPRVIYGEEEYVPSMNDIEAEKGQYFPKSGYFKVDLSGSNESLLREFEKLLKQLRVKMDSPPPPTSLNVTEAKLGKLKNYRILAVLDLIIWQYENNVRIKKSTFAHAVFPDLADKGERELTDTIIPFAKRSITPEFILNLMSLKDF